MTNRNGDVPQGEGGNLPPVSSNDQDPNRAGNKVYKTGPLFISSKGIGWTSWKKRWFVLTRTSLVFFRSDPTAAPQKGGEANLTLGGIDLNSSGSVVVKEDKKLLTMLFPDGRDGRTFTLKAETLEDLLEWKTALEEALVNAPSAALMVGQNGVFRNDQANGVDASSEQSKDRPPMKSLVIGQPVLLALEEVDGTPSFLEKALKFLEENGLKVEGILRQAAYVDDVERRIREYEQGKVEFSADEDAHVIADCIKYILRELPSSPVPASCCSALLDACRIDRGMRVNAIRSAILETFPEPNRRLLQRILVMMRHVVAYKNENRMSTSAVAACMAPLLLRPLLSGECELEHTFDLGGDGSAQLLQAAAAANHAQAIVITLLEEYDNIFGEGSVQPELYSDSDGSGSGSEELTDDDGSYEGSDYDEEGEEEYEDDGDDADEGSDADIIEDSEHASNATSETGNDCASKVSSPRSPELGNALETKGRIGSTESNAESSDMSPSQNSRNYATVPAVQRQALLGRVPGKKKKSMEAVAIAHDDDADLERLEATKTDLQNRIAEEGKVNQVLQEGMEKRRITLHERRFALEKEVARLQELLEKEQELRMIFAAQLTNPQGSQSIPSTINRTVKAKLEEIAQIEVDVMNLKQKASDIEAELNKQREQNMKYHTEAGIPHQKPNYQGKLKDKAEGDKDKKNDFQLAVNKPLINFNAPAASFAASVESLLANRPPTITKKSGSKTEGATTSSALTKLTNRLNFLKEQSQQPPDKPKPSDGQNNPDREKSESSGSSSSSSAPDKSRNKVSPRTASR
ncbi:PREDICTED: rho GTPase-activating protein REN1-like isoform X2 [Ipomoea nil]|uniref:rho GTPase-activating protein REN1-like isoform X2 n=1 Tax=Ipomoea nil TaxID=35883 RepID=UPI00090122C6|nr:PREDICTED: rho GTPase-activating protein REN1-like isoform X2 [Ipomoea nil]